MGRWKFPSSKPIGQHRATSFGEILGKELQIPCNPSVSFTLDQCRTTTTVGRKQIDAQDDVLFSIQYDGKPAPSFEFKIKPLSIGYCHMPLFKV